MHRQTRFTLHPLRRALRVFALAMPLGITGLATSQGLAQAVPLAQEYRIEAGSLATVVSTFAAQSGVLLSAPAQGLEGRRSPGLQGRYTPAEGFQQILQGSGLQAVRQADDSYRLEAIPASGVTSLSETTAAIRSSRISLSSCIRLSSRLTRLTSCRPVMTTLTRPAPD